MTEIGESVAVAVIALADEQEKLVDCKWKDCPGEIHKKKPPYPENGNVKRNSSYSADWVAAGLEPWVKHGPGKDSKATLADYRAETPKARYAATAAALEHPEYHTQKHHLISVNLFGNVSKLAHDAKLIGYDVNHKNNGICLPTYVVDIIRHDLQAHRGSHPNNLYNSKISPLLRNIEKLCVDYCKVDTQGDADNQKRLIDDLNRLSRRTEDQIRSWRWLLRKGAIKEREESAAMYEEKS